MLRHSSGFWRGLLRAAALNDAIHGRMITRLQAIGNNYGLIIDEPILELLNITADTELEVTTDGERLIVTPIRSVASHRDRVARAQEKVLAAHERTFRKLAE